MARVHLGTEHRRFTGGQAELEVDARNVSQIIKKLDAQFPGIGELLAECAVAIDGEIVAEPAYEPVSPEAEVYFVFKPTGG